MLKFKLLAATITLNLSGCALFTTPVYSPDNDNYETPSDYVWIDTEEYIKKLEKEERDLIIPTVVVVKNIELEFFIPFAYGKAWRPTYEGYKILQSVAKMNDLISVSLIGYSVSNQSHANSAFAERRRANTKELLLNMNEDLTDRLATEPNILKNNAVANKTGVMLKLVLPG